MRQEHIPGYFVLDFDNTSSSSSSNNTNSNETTDFASTSVIALPTDDTTTVDSFSNSENLTSEDPPHSLTSLELFRHDDDLTTASVDADLEESTVTSANNGVDSISDHGGRDGRGVDQDSAVTPSQASNRVNLSWDHQTIVIFLNDIIKPNYMSLINMPNTQLRGERWDQMTVTFKRLMNENGLNVGVPNDIITPKKLQYKWGDLKKNFHSIQRVLNGTRVGGGTGEERWPYYNHLFEILRDDPSVNLGVNVESMVRNRRHGITTSMTPRAEPAIAESQRNIEVAASSSVESSIISTSDTNIGTVTLNSTNCAGPSSRLPTRGTRRTREEYEEEYEEEIDATLFERLLGMHHENEERSREALQSLVTSMREENEAFRRDQRQQHQQMLEMLERTLRESDDRWLSVIAPFFNARNRNGENNNNHNNNN
ncbi:hypothetical protein F4703DRAFT_1882247 [Phycomyces blakesleeanus]